MNKIPKGIKCEVTPEVVYQHGVPPIPDGWEFASFDYPSAHENWLCILPGAANIQFGKCPAPRIIVRPVPPKPTYEQLEEIIAHEKAWVKHWQDRFDGAQAREDAWAAEANRLRGLLDKASIKGVMGTYDPNLGKHTEDDTFLTEEQLQCIERHYPEAAAYERMRRDRAEADKAAKVLRRRWVVERSEDYPRAMPDPIFYRDAGFHGIWETGRDQPISLGGMTILREVKPITRQQIAAAHSPNLSSLTYINFLKNLGIEVEE